MEMVLLTALGVGGATIFGSCIGFIFKDLGKSQKKHEKGYEKTLKNYTLDFFTV